MSAWITSKAHIDAMVTFALAEPGSFASEPSLYVYYGNERIDFSAANADKVGQMLTDTIVTGVSHRYPNDDVKKGELPGPTDGWYLQPYRYRRTRKIADGEMVALIECYDYQASEHDDWSNTFGHTFCKAVEYALLTHIQKAFEAEHGKTQWGYEEEHVHEEGDLIAYAVELEDGGVPIVRLLAISAAAARAEAEAVYGGKAVKAYPHPDPLPEPQPTPATDAIQEFLAEVDAAEAKDNPVIRNNKDN